MVCSFIWGNIHIHTRAHIIFKFPLFLRLKCCLLVYVVESLQRFVARVCERETENRLQLFLVFGTRKQDASVFSRICFCENENIDVSMFIKGGQKCCFLKMYLEHLNSFALDTQSLMIQLIYVKICKKTLYNCSIQTIA
jgi:hypothetical protein